MRGGGGGGAYFLQDNKGVGDGGWDFTPQSATDTDRDRDIQAYQHRNGHKP